MQFSKKDQEILRQIYRFAKSKKVKLYLVGGALRDLLLKREKENPDFDFCLKRGAISFARKLADKMDAGFVVLDKEHGAARLVQKMGSRVYTFDFTDFRGPTLEKDLLHRDFTVNAIAMELERAVAGDNIPGLLIDPHAGQRDLKAKVIRLVNPKSFSEDPLRILRAFSFSAVLGFRIDGQTLKLTQKQREKLGKVSFERIRDELFKIFEADSCGEHLRQLDELKILKVIFPEIEQMRGVGGGPYHHLDVWQHSLEAVSQLDALIKGLDDDSEIRHYLQQYISAGHRRKALLKFGALLHDIGKPKAMRRKGKKIIFHGHERIGLGIAQHIAKRLKLSGDEASALRRQVLWHLRPGFLADNQRLTPRAIFRFFRDTQDEAVSVLLLSLADQRATRGPLTTRQSRLRHEKVVSGLIKEYFRRRKEKKLPRLLNGDVLMKEFKLQPSPLIGRLLSGVEELQAIGKIKTAAEALKAAGKILRNAPKNLR
ncbi:MAG: HD domain-containing protein [Candidatus Omnitrophota bacterium]|nr:HD domain-containing protein [Candidatus Omnitrophota bacterium]